MHFVFLNSLNLHLIGVHSTNHCWAAVNQAGSPGTLVPSTSPGSLGTGLFSAQVSQSFRREVAPHQTRSSELSTGGHQTPCKVQGEGALPALASSMGKASRRVVTFWK